MNFRVGQKVVCVDDNGYLPYWAPVVRGAVLTVRAIVPGLSAITGAPTVGLLFEEIRNGPCPVNGKEFSYHIDFFRPAVEPDISVFTAMLSKTPAENLAAAKRIKRKEKAHV